VNATMNLRFLMKCGEFIEGVKTCWFLRKDSVPWGSILLIKSY
jgi:hypothetical protein